MQKASLFSPSTQALVFNFKNNPVQSMLDFDFVSGRKTPSVAGLIKAGAVPYCSQKFFFGKKEVLIDVHSSIKDAVQKNPQADVFINFASYRSAYASSVEALNCPTINTVIIVAEGVPENQTRRLVALSKKLGKWVIGPATVGGIQAGAFKIGYAAGPVQNVLKGKLYRPGSVGLVTKSGGLSNEMYNVLSRSTDGLFEGIAIGGDVYPGSGLIDHALRFEHIPQIKMIVILGELGGIAEYSIVKALKEKRITKPVICWVSGTCATVFPTEVQFGHAGAKSGSLGEGAKEKNTALKEAGAIVPQSFEDFEQKIRDTFQRLAGNVDDLELAPPKKLPKDYKQATALGKVRRATSFVSTICDDRGDEPLYAGVSVSELIAKEKSLGDVISLLWFKRKLPRYASRFIEICLMLVADHGPCVSGAHNTIVAARAGKDVVSSVASGLLTIGPRFGGAIDGAAKYFKMASDEGLSPEQYVVHMKRKGIVIPGIGHRIKSANNPDVRVTILKNYARDNFPTCRHLEYALAVEKITLQKSNNLILNVDGCLAVLFLDLMEGSESFTRGEADTILKSGTLNGLFVLGRTIGLIGHSLDQKRLRQPLYRHPWDDVMYTQIESRDGENENGANGLEADSVLRPQDTESTAGLVIRESQ